MLSCTLLTGEIPEMSYCVCIEEAEAETAIVAAMTRTVNVIVVETEMIVEAARHMISQDIAADLSHHETCSQKMTEDLDDVRAHQFHADGICSHLFIHLYMLLFHLSFG